jgi:hemolysin D
MPIVKFSQPKQRNSAAAVARSFESPTAEVIARRHPFKERAVLYILSIFLAVILVFISVVHLDRVVAAKGRIIPTGGAITVQPLDKAIISRVLVTVGDVVKKGQVLATCDPTFVQADLAAMREKVASLDAQRRRMETEHSGGRFRPDPSKPSDLFQSSVLQQRATEFQAGLNDFDQRIHSSEAQIAGYKESIADLQGRLKIAQETEGMYTKMESEGIVTRLDLIGMQDKTLDMQNQLSEQQTELAAAQHSIESLREQRKVYVDKWDDDNLDKLTVVRDDYQQAVNDLTKAEKLSELVDLRSPVDAVVLKVPDLSSGGVATDAEPLFSLMPINAPIEVDAEVDSHDSGFVKVGDKVTIKFDAFKFLEHGTGEGVVRTVSQDSFVETDEQDTVMKDTAKEMRPPYFDSRITLTGLHLHDVPADVRIIPGMTLEADIIVGRRTIMWYLFGGALRSGADAMHEP